MFDATEEISKHISGQAVYWGDIRKGASKAHRCEHITEFLRRKLI
jgi:hypothetical protein